MKKRCAVTRFFKVMVLGFQYELPIPPKFARNITIPNHRRATIRDPKGRSWHANVEGRGKDLSFNGVGWMDFVKGLGISLGYFLVFKYNGNMEFKVKVFDPSGCESEYSHEVCCHLPNYSAHAIEVSSPLDNQREIKASNTMEKVLKQFCKSLGPHFSVTLKFCHLRFKPYLNIPLAFLASHDMGSTSRAILIDPKGRSLPVRVYARKRRPVIQCCFGKGWHEFCLQNHLSAGDRCVFELAPEEPAACAMYVHIFRE